MTSEDRRFPFGATVRPCAPSADEPRQVFVLGAYPSALHVRWNAPDGTKVVALPVDNEPEPFWSGEGVEELVEEWKTRTALPEVCGTVKANGNGKAGAWLDDKVLATLGVKRSDVWITDCLDRYHSSSGIEKAMEERFLPFAERNGLPPATLLAHPSETDVVRRALTPQRRAELRAQIEKCQPETVVTLGNAALRVLRELIDVNSDGPGPSLHADETYGRRFTVSVGSQQAMWLPLAHPSSTRAYQVWHTRWQESAFR